MKRALTAAGLALLVTACSLTRPLQANALPTPVRTSAARYIVVTLRNEPLSAAEHPGSTPRGYDAAGRYGITGSASLQAKALERDYGLREISAWPIATLHVHCIMFQLPDTTARLTMIARLANDRRVESVQPLNEFTTQSEPETLRAVPEAVPVQVPYNDPYAKLQVSLRELAVVPAQRHSRGAGIQIAVIDTGMDFDHPDLKGRVLKRHNFVDADEAKFGQDLHGTEVSGVIAAVADNGIGIVGIAPDARIIALKACWQAVSGGSAVCNSFTLAQALEAAIVAHADIVNMSLAGPPDAVDAAEDSSGNPRHLLAPGRDVLTLVPGGHYDFASGSSLAAAEVSGIVALMLAEHPHLTATEVRNLLLRSSRRVDSPAGEILAVDACAALTDVRGHGSCGTEARPGTTASMH
jgi:subtilisin family serine protease